MSVLKSGILSTEDAVQAKNDFIYLMKCGLTAQDATNKIIELGDDCAVDSDVEAEIVFSLADVQWSYGCLVSSIKYRAIELIDSSVGLSFWMNNDELLLSRKKILANLKRKLLKSVPAKKYIEPLSRARGKINYFPSGKIGYVYSVEVDKNQYMPFILVDLTSPGKDTKPVFHALPFVFDVKKFSLNDIPFVNRYVVIEGGLGVNEIFGFLPLRRDENIRHWNFYEVGELKGFNPPSGDIYPTYITWSGLGFLPQVLAQCQFIYAKK